MKQLLRDRGSRAIQPLHEGKEGKAAAEVYEEQTGDKEEGS